MYETARMPSFRAFRSDQFMNLHRFGGLSLLRNDLLNKCEFSLFSICSVCFRRHDHENVRFLLKLTLSVTVQSGFIWKDENALVITGQMSRIRPKFQRIHLHIRWRMSIFLIVAVFPKAFEAFYRTLENDFLSNYRGVNRFDNKKLQEIAQPTRL